jgi:hypothetical protein
LFALLLPQQMASAQVPPVGQCVQNPSSCVPDVPDVPDVDPCIQNPQSCLPDPPDPDPCLADPASCLPDPEQVDIPDASDPEGCVNDVRACLSNEDPGGGDPSGDEDRGGTAAPVRGSKPSGGGGSTSQPGRGPGPGVAATGGGVAAGEPVADSVSFTDPESGGSGGLGAGVAEATRRFAFPIGIAALVGAFLLVQGRVDRKEPKLAAAPIDSRDDLVIYR